MGLKRPPRPSNYPTNRGIGGHAQANAVEANRARTGPRKPNHTGHPASGDRQYSDEESAFLVAVAEFQSRTGIRFLLATHYLAILESLGYRKAE